MQLCLNEKLANEFLNREPTVNIFKYVGLVCIIYRCNMTGNYNGYVGVKPYNSMHKKDCFYLENKINLQDFPALTFAGDRFDSVFSNTWFFGFDTNNSWDTPMWSFFNDEFNDQERKYKTYQNVEDSVMRLADQLVRFNN